MYLPRSFDVRDRPLLLELMRAYPFATVVGVRDGNPEVAHLPLLVHERDGELQLAGHVARGNPLARLVEASAPLTAVFHGPHGYVSPRFYVSAPHVPTWNFVAIHARGASRLIDGAGALQHLDVLAATFETGAERPWTLDDARDLSREIAPGIVAFEIDVATLEGKLKLSQNREHEDWTAVRDRFAVGERDERAMAELMNRLGPPRS